MNMSYKKSSLAKPQRIYKRDQGTENSEKKEVLLTGTDDDCSAVLQSPNLTTDNVIPAATDSVHNNGDLVQKHEESPTEETNNKVIGEESQLNMPVKEETHSVSTYTSENQMNSSAANHEHSPKSVVIQSKFVGAMDVNGESRNSSFMDFGNLMNNIKQSKIGRKIQEGIDNIGLKQQSSTTTNTIANIPNFILFAFLAIFGSFIVGTAIFFLIIFVSVPLMFILPMVFVGVVALDFMRTAFNSFKTQAKKSKDFTNRKIFVRVGKKEDVEGSKIGGKPIDFSYKKIY